jgi:hypothetical protein
MSTPSYDDAIRADRRLAILEILAAAPDYTAHAHLIRKQLDGQGHRTAFDVLRGDLAWLDEQGALVLADGEVPVATLTLRGEDLARGVARVPGVARPVPAR